MNKMNRPIVWSIAGSDPGGGAGIQADLKTINALGAHGCSVVTALTVQNTTGVSVVEYPSISCLKAQLDALACDLPPVALKLGMLGSPEAIRIIANTIYTFKTQGFKPYVVCDPVMVSTSGHRLLEPDALNALIQDLLPLVDLVTPNLHEAEILTRRTIRTSADIEAAACDLLALGIRSVLIKGGHGNQIVSQDYWTNGLHQAWFSSPRQDSSHTHGTGCTLSAAITTCIGLGFEERDAVVIAKAYVNQGIRNTPKLGSGNGPLAHLGWPEEHDDLPWLTTTAEAGQQSVSFPAMAFPDCGETPLGFYPIVDRFAWLKKLLPLGVTTIQLRIKDLSGEELEREIAQASAYARQFNCRLFINDYWRLAVKYGAYGVHLGQEDLKEANIETIRQAGLRLGISTHCYWEVARALAIKPSYIAIGPVFSTTTKNMRFAPQGLEALRRWRKSLPYPLVAIAGIFLENAPEVLETGVDSIAVVRDITNAANLPERVASWLALFETHQGAQKYDAPRIPSLR